MNESENQRAQKEAVETSSKVTRSADRARFWAGLNRYLSAEAEHAHKVAREEKDAERKSSGRTGSDRTRADDDTT
jgi:hypothetical protein